MKAIQRIKPMFAKDKLLDAFKPKNIIKIAPYIAVSGFAMTMSNSVLGQQLELQAWGMTDAQSLEARERALTWSLTWIGPTYKFTRDIYYKALDIESPSWAKKLFHDTAFYTLFCAATMPILYHHAPEAILPSIGLYSLMSPVTGPITGATNDVMFNLYGLESKNEYSFLKKIPSVAKKILGTGLILGTLGFMASMYDKQTFYDRYPVLEKIENKIENLENKITSEASTSLPSTTHLLSPN